MYIYMYQIMYIHTETRALGLGRRLWAARQGGLGGGPKAAAIRCVYTCIYV